MNLRNTLALLVLFILLGGYVYFVEFKQHEKEQKIEEQEQQVFTFKKDSIETITLKNKYGNFVLKKINGEWRITDPLYTGTDESTVTAMLNNMASAKKDKVFSVKPGDLSQYGLTSRAVKVEFETPDGKADSIRFGDKTPVGSFVFCSKIDSVVFTTNQNIKTSYDKKLFDLRDKKMLHFERNDVSEIVVNNPHGKFEFRKNGTNWELLNLNRPADNGKISSILSRLTNSKAKDFVDEEGENLRKFGLDRPRYQAELQLGPEKGQRRLLISRKMDGKYYAKDDSRKPVFEIDSIVVNDLNKTMTEFRSTDFADFDRNKVNKVLISYSDTLLTFLKDSTNNWTLQDSAGRAVKSAKMSSFFSSLDYATISDYVKDGKYNPASYGLADPSLNIHLYNGDELILNARLGRKKGESIYAATDKYQSVYLIPASKLKDLKLKPQDVLEAPVKEAEEISQE